MREGQQSGTRGLRPSRALPFRVRRPTPVRSQGGYTLIEVLIAVFLIGTVIAALAAGMLTMMRSTATTAEQQRLAAGVLSYTEWLRSQEYRPCATTGDFPAWSDLPRIDGRVDQVRYWNVDAGADWGGAPYTASCGTDQGRQLLDVTLELDGGRATTSAQVVLRGEP